MTRSVLYVLAIIGLLLAGWSAMARPNSHNSNPRNPPDWPAKAHDANGG